MRTSDIHFGVRYYEKCINLLKRSNYYIIGILFLVFALSWGVGIYQDYHIKSVYFLDVGQGDSSVILSGKTCYIVDGGTDSDVLESFLKAHHIRRVEGVFVSHMHEDHIGGIIDLLDDFQVKTLYVNSLYKKVFTRSVRKDEDVLFWQLMDSAKDNNVHVDYVSQGDVIKTSLDTMQWTCLYTDSVKQENKNENSLVIVLNWDKLSILYTGDMEAVNEKAMYDKYKGSNLNIDILKVGHHGSDTSSTGEFLDLLDPQIAIISVGENTYGHPSEIVLERLVDREIPFYTTQKYGMIEIQKTEKGFNLIPKIRG